MDVKPNGLLGACIALVGIFTAGLLLVSGVLPFWAGLRETPPAQAALAGVNTSVVGVLGATLYSAVQRPSDFSIALAAFLLLVRWRMSPWNVVLQVAIRSMFLPI